MKYLLPLLSLHFLSLICLAQPNPDTAVINQLSRIEANKSYYIGKTFSVFYNALAVKPKTVEGIIAQKNIYIERGHVFYFEIPDSTSDTFIYIEWQEPPLKTQTLQYQNKVERNFNIQEYPTYKDLIISKLELYPNGIQPPPPPPPGRWIVVSSVYKKVKLEDGLYYWRYEITKKYCQNGILGITTQVSYATTNEPVESCVTPVTEPLPIE